jgi:hypothetical protein
MQPEETVRQRLALRAPLRLDLRAVEAALQKVERQWRQIDAQLDRHHIGRKDRFSAFLRGNMVTAYTLLDDLVSRNVHPFSRDGIGEMLTLNNRVHYGRDRELMAEFAKAVDANTTKFYDNIEPIIAWYERHAGRGDHPLKLAAETYVAILGHPQLFIEGNHRTGALIASWINLCAGFPPFVLSTDNAIAYFSPSAEIKRFADKSTWRGRARLPKYRKIFRAFWEHHIEARYVAPD